MNRITIFLLTMAIILTNICHLSTDIRDIAMKNNLVEEIQVGNSVLSENELTGEVTVKTVTETYVNETDELIHIGVNGETISATPSHPFYVYKFGWTLAGSLRAGDILVLSNGELVTVEFVQHEILENPIKVYNFEVQDFHTYFVGECGVLVHNWCQDDIDLLQNGSNNTTVEVKNKKEADELLNSAFPDYQKVNGIGLEDASELRRKRKMDRFKQGGTYHKDYAMVVDEKTGKRIVKGHDVNNPHSQYPHINIKRKDGKKVLINIIGGEI